ncbi:tRNA A64-2'-O-ribosylphosphate transferase [Zalerion maritima]|uniref:tRNA A64-2'-O-ribosylphosphate transferase n=1 Tax=Zalerion maritima TaxID=339359 RepID=A0AAD5WSV3_9PEZI|nr:tRNA A64-2'-O-ribosylphosphate transferase [Zalerion maritima]
MPPTNLSDIIFSPASSAPSSSLSSKPSASSSANSTSQGTTRTLNALLTDLKRSSLSISNRLKSIDHDARFVARVAEAYGFDRHGEGVIANERCGSWYVPTYPPPPRKRPGEAVNGGEEKYEGNGNGKQGGNETGRGANLKRGSAYFKSTDGHTGQWGFSSRRLNLQVLEAVGRDGGGIIIDSTRRGKRMPDALSKTIPIWVTVFNRVLFPKNPEWHKFYTPPAAVGRSEHAQIEASLPKWAEQLEGLELDWDDLRKKVGGRGIRCLWVGPDSDLPSWDGEEDGENEGEGSDEEVTHDDNNKQSQCARERGRQNRRKNIFPTNNAHPLILVTASKRVLGGEIGEPSGSSLSHFAASQDGTPDRQDGGQGFVYVQGAADDTENWARGLTAPLWWEHRETLLGTPDGELEETVDRIVADDKAVQGLPGRWEKIKALISEDTWKPHATEIGPGIWIGHSELGLDQDPGLLTYQDERRLGDDATTKTTNAAAAAAAAAAAGAGATAVILLTPPISSPETWIKSPSVMVVGVGKHKVASRNLRKALPSICSFAAEWMAAGSPPSPAPRSSSPAERNILVLSAAPTDISVGAALALHCCIVSDPLALRPRLPPKPPRPRDSGHEAPGGDGGGRGVAASTKSLIRVRTAKLVAAMPAANPRRATLQSVNSYLMDYGSGWPGGPPGSRWLPA